MYILNRWEKRRTPQGREYFINHYTHTTQWNKPLRYCIQVNTSCIQYYKLYLFMLVYFCSCVHVGVVKCDTV